MLFSLWILLLNNSFFSIRSWHVSVLSSWRTIFIFLFLSLRHFSSFLSLLLGDFSLINIRFPRLVHHPIYSWLFSVIKHRKCVCLVSIFIFDCRLMISIELNRAFSETFLDSLYQKQKWYRKNLVKKGLYELTRFKHAARMNVFRRKIQELFQIRKNYIR
jgi:hypothetical protein